MKNKIKSTQFPNIYRIITENKLIKRASKIELRLLNQSKHKKVLTYFLSITVISATILLSVGISVLAARLYQDANMYVRITKQRQVMQEKINFWQSFKENYDGYKDAYFQIALLEYQLGNFEKAKEYNKQALLLDPGFDDAKNLGVLLENK
nr:hypothetical protein [Candidatus Levybacteria bacterium]